MGQVIQVRASRSIFLVKSSATALITSDESHLTLDLSATIPVGRAGLVELDALDSRQDIRERPIVNN